MTQIVLNIPENKVSFFLELIEQLGYINSEENIIITEEDKKVVRKRFKNFERKKMVAWKDAHKSLKGK
jgi:hypothetical protein